MVDIVIESNFFLILWSGGSSTKSFRPEAKKKGGWVKTILEKKSIYWKNSTSIFRSFWSISDQICV